MNNRSIEDSFVLLFILAGLLIKSSEKWAERQRYNPMLSVKTFLCLVSVWHLKRYWQRLIQWFHFLGEKFQNSISVPLFYPCRRSPLSVSFLYQCIRDMSGLPKTVENSPMNVNEELLNARQECTVHSLKFISEFSTVLGRLPISRRHWYRRGTDKELWQLSLCEKE